MCFKLMYQFATFKLQGGKSKSAFNKNKLQGTENKSAINECKL